MTNAVSKERMGALSDGVIAIAATILVLELSVPEDATLDAEIALHWLRVMIGWIISFAMIALVWFDSHALFRHARDWSVPLAVLTMLQLAAVSLIPFASNLIIDYPDSLAAGLTFSGVMLANGLIAAGMGWVLSRSGHLHAFDHTGALLRQRARGQVTICLAVAAAAVGAALLHHPFTGVLFWALSPALVALVGRGMGPARVATP
jgi:uncharacterized membrane protein